MVDSMKLLDLGCGVRKRKRAIGVDIIKNSDADIIHDLNIFPYPFNDNEFDDVFCDNILEHLDNVVKVMEEIWRISKNGAVIKIFVPYFRSRYAFAGTTHRNYFSVESFYYYKPDHIYNKLYRCSSVTFDVEKIIFDERIRGNLFQRTMKSFSNKYPQIYENKFSHLYPLSELTFILKVLK